MEAHGRRFITIYNDDEGVYYHFASVQRAGGFRMLTEISTADGFKILFRYTTKGALKEIVDSRGETLYVNTDCQGRVEKIFRRANSKDISSCGLPL